MIIDRYERPTDWSAPRLSDPILPELDWIVADPQLFALVRHDFQKHYRASRLGRHPVPVEVTLRMTILRRRKKWSYRQTEHEVRDSPAYRDWVRVYDQAVPDHSTLNALEKVVRPCTLHRLNDRVLVLAQDYRLTQGYRSRVDSTVTDSNIHHPTDSSLLADGVRVLSRLLERAAPFVPTAVRQSGVCRNRTRSARRCARHIAQLSRPTPSAKRPPTRRELKKKAVNKAYTELLTITQASLAQAEQVSALLTDATDASAQRLWQQFNAFRPLVRQAIDQARRRVLHGENLPAADKVVSLFEPHTQIIRRGKPKPRDTEFGHKVNLAEVEHGFISDWQIIATGNPPDEQLLPARLHHHVKLFGHAPHVLAGDRGLFSPENEQLAKRLGVQQIALPQPGHRDAQRQALEQQRWFKKAQRFRNGIEGRISVVKRTLQLARCPNRGLAGFERWIGWGVIVANLVVMARTLHRRHSRKRRR